jgi:hypothetical protein
MLALLVCQVSSKYFEAAVQELETVFNTHYTIQIDALKFLFIFCNYING